MTSDLFKHLNEQLGVFLNAKQQKWRYPKTYKMIFAQKRYQFYQVFTLFEFLKISYVLL